MPMINDQQRDVVEQLLDAIRRDPTRMPLAEVAALRAAGLDVDVDRRTGTDVVFMSPRGDARLTRLSPREREVAMLAAAGYSNQQIATALFVSLATAKDHMHSALQKTELSSRAQLIAAWYGGFSPAGSRAD